MYMLHDYTLLFVWKFPVGGTSETPHTVGIIIVFSPVYNGKMKVGLLVRLRSYADNK